MAGQKIALAMQFGNKHTLKFSHNWNRKLHCDYFTTIRIHNEEKYRPGNKLDVIWGGQNCDPVEIIDRKVFFLKDMNHFMASLDTGYTLEEAKEIIRKIYSNVKPSPDQIRYDFVLCKWIKTMKDLTQSTLFKS